MENKSRTLNKYHIGNFTGAFADGAILFPLLTALTIQTGMNSAVLLGTAGMAYIVAGIIFRVPMAVQPLKSVVVAAIAMGATAAEVRWSGFAVGAICLALSSVPVDRVARLVPKHLVHGLQMALGIMLMTKSIQSVFSADLYTQVIFSALAAAIILLCFRTKKPVMGWLATAGILAGIFSAFDNTVTSTFTPGKAAHVNVIIALVLPQLALTLANSVIGTQDAAMRYFGADIAPSRLLRSIGIGNLITAPLGGLPFCHGAGGLTAHVRGGARTWHMNLIIGGTLVALAAASWILSIHLIPAYPKLLMNVLLFSVGWFHLGLVEPSWQRTGVRWILGIMAIVALVTQNMLWVLAAGVVCEICSRIWLKKKEGA